MSQSHASHHSLRLNDFSVLLHLGHSAEERATPQEVRISFELRFRTQPAACITDELEDTICYFELCERLRQNLVSREFKMIEKIGAECESILRNIAGTRAQIGVLIHKVHPPVQGVLGGATFRCGDFLL